MPCYSGKYADELISNAASLGNKPFVDVMKEDIVTIEGSRRCAQYYLSDEAISNAASRDSKLFVDVMKEATVTIEGHDAQRCAQYYLSGSRFARCHSVFKIGPYEPSELEMDEKADELAQYALICQQNGLVPIIEPEILVDGPHDIKRCEGVTEGVLLTCLAALIEHHVLLKGVVFSINMVTPGSDAKKVSPKEVAHYTLLSLQNSMPAAVPVVVFMSGGQTEEEANLNINAINQYDGKIPWKLSISFWKYQNVLLERCKAKL